MTRKQLPFFLAFLVLMFGAMACACLGSGAGIGGITATANAVASQAMATVNAAGGSNTGGAATSTPAAAQATSAGTGGGGSTIPGGPADIPAISGDKTSILATAQLVTYQTKTDSATVIAFYKDAMPKNGWTADATSSVETPQSSVLGYKKDTRTAVVTITKDPNSGGTIVAIAVQ